MGTRLEDDPQRNKDKQVIKYGRMIVSSALSACYIPKSPSFAELQDLQDCVTALRLLKKWSQCQELSKGAMSPWRIGCSPAKMGENSLVN